MGVSDPQVVGLAPERTMRGPSYLMFQRQIEEAERNIAALQETIDSDPEITPLKRKTLNDLQWMYREIMDHSREAMQEIR
jgi:hypothetical protein